MSGTNSPNMPTARVGNAAGKSTRERMLMTALRLYAEEGLDRVTLRKISVESGCSNTAAAQYHFRNRDGLIMAIVAFLEEAVWQPGRERLRTAIDEQAGLRDIIALGLWPWRITVFEHSWGGHAQAFCFRALAGADAVARSAVMAGQSPHLTMLHDALRARLPDLDDAIFEQRWHFFITEAVAGQWVRAYVFKVTEHGAGQSSQEIEHDYLMRYLDYVEGGLTAPTTEQQSPALAKVNAVLYP